MTGLATNTRGAYETTLAYPLELEGTWEVVLINITYPHIYLDLEKQCMIGISTVYNRHNKDNVDIIEDANDMELVNALIDVESY